MNPFSLNYFIAFFLFLYKNIQKIKSINYQSISPVSKYSKMSQIQIPMSAQPNSTIKASQVLNLSKKGKSNKQKLFQQIKHQNKFDNLAAESITSSTLKFIFNLLVKLSYFFFLDAVALISLMDGQQKTIFLNFIKNENNHTQIYILVGLGACIITLFKVFKENSSISKERRKQINFITDHLRIGTYIFLAVFVHPFVSQNESNNAIFGSYYLFCTAIGLFVIRKIMKWYYYYLDPNGKKNYTPWANKYTPDETINKEENQRNKIEAFVISLVDQRIKKLELGYKSKNK